LVRQNAKILYEQENSDLIIIDGPPGIGCPVIASVTGVDAGLVVTEPTISGIHDLKRALQVLKHFNVEPFVCINMYDINRDNTEKISCFCKENSIEIAGKVCFSRKVTDVMVNGKTVLEYAPQSDVARDIKSLWQEVRSFLNL
jgi:MinD superfamily P-loop ATPase